MERHERTELLDVQPAVQPRQQRAAAGQRLQPQRRQLDRGRLGRGPTRRLGAQLGARRRRPAVGAAPDHAQVEIGVVRHVRLAQRVRVEQLLPVPGEPQPLGLGVVNLGADELLELQNRRAVAERLVQLDVEDLLGEAALLVHHVSRHPHGAHGDELARGPLLVVVLRRAHARLDVARAPVDRADAPAPARRHVHDVFCT